MRVSLVKPIFLLLKPGSQEPENSVVSRTLGIL